MAPLSPNALAAVKSELERLKASSPTIGNQIKLRGLPRLPGLNDGLIFPIDKFPEGTSLNHACAAALNKAPLRGPINVLVVLVDFPDKSFAEGSTKEHFENLFFSDGTAQLSVNEYYKTVSNGAIRMTGAVAGPYCMPYKLSYYANDLSAKGGTEPNAQTLAQHAVQAVNADLTVGSLAGFDNNGDGYMDAFVVVHAGPGAETLLGQEQAQNIWSLKWVLPNEFKTRDGPCVYSFLTVPEDSQVGVCAHEVGHLIFGWPDLYDSDYSSAGLGKWCLMAGGNWNTTNGVQGTLPCDPSAWCKMKQGWVKVEKVGNNPQQPLQIMDVKKGDRKVYRVDIKADGTEYLLMENRQRIGLDMGLPGAGLLIYHIDETVETNKNEWHPKIMLLQADGRADLNNNKNNGDEGDPFPGLSNVTEISDDTTPNTSSYYQTRSGIRISLISNPGETMTCQVSKAQRVPRFGTPLFEKAAANFAARGLELTVLPPAPAAGGPLATPTAVAGAVAPGPAKNRTDELLEQLLAQERLNTTVLLQLVKLLAVDGAGNLSAMAKLFENGQNGHAT